MHKKRKGRHGRPGYGSDRIDETDFESIQSHNHGGCPDLGTASRLSTLPVVIENFHTTSNHSIIPLDCQDHRETLGRKCKPQNEDHFQCVADWRQSKSRIADSIYGRPKPHRDCGSLYQRIRTRLAETNCLAHDPQPTANLRSSATTGRDAQTMSTSFLTIRRI